MAGYGTFTLVPLIPPVRRFIALRISKPVGRHMFN